MSRNIRIIPRLDIKGPNLVKGIHLEGVRVVGDPQAFARRYYEAGADELIYMDVVASLYNRNNLFHIVEEVCKEVFIPITIGGGLRTLGDMEKALKSGADKVALNTQAVRTPELISEAAKRFGSQSIVGSVEAKRKNGSWEAYVDNGRESTGLDALTWVKQLEELGAGEILLTSVDQEGTRKGFDIELITKALELVSIPLIASGGAGTIQHMADLAKGCNIDAIAVATILHYNVTTIGQIKSSLRSEGVMVRS